MSVTYIDIQDIPGYPFIVSQRTDWIKTLEAIPAGKALILSGTRYASAKQRLLLYQRRGRFLAYRVRKVKGTTYVIHLDSVPESGPT